MLKFAFLAVGALAISSNEANGPSDKRPLVGFSQSYCEVILSSQARKLGILNESVHRVVVASMKKNGLNIVSQEVLGKLAREEVDFAGGLKFDGDRSSELRKERYYDRLSSAIFVAVHVSPPKNHMIAMSVSFKFCRRVRYYNGNSGIAPVIVETIPSIVSLKSDVNFQIQQAISAAAEIIAKKAVADIKPES